MTYELAKQLRDAGFNFRQVNQWDGKRCFLFQPFEYGANRIGFYEPTLSELIAACGKQFHELHHCGHGFKDNETWEWTVYAHEGLPHHEYKGQTPEEAVARLWLALQSFPPTPAFLRQS